MKNVAVQVSIIILVIAACVGLSVYIGYELIKDKIPTDNNNNQLTILDNINNTINTDNNKETKKEETPVVHYNKLMIVAHPDDDTIFGGAHLIQDEYTVVCVTCGVVKLRLNEFFNAMAYSGDKYIYLSHTDLTKNYYISDWTGEKEKINQELKEIIESQDWDLIVTHNPDGEYGHKHHKMTSKMVTDNVKDKKKLYYFGKFKVKGTVDDTPTLSENIFKKKKEMLAIYKSQPACTNKGKLTYAFDHENWVKYSDWT